MQQLPLDPAGPPLTPLTASIAAAEAVAMTSLSEASPNVLITPLSLACSLARSLSLAQSHTHTHAWMLCMVSKPIRWHTHPTRRDKTHAAHMACVNTGHEGFFLLAATIKVKHYSVSRIRKTPTPPPPSTLRDALIPICRVCECVGVCVCVSIRVGPPLR